MIHLASQQHISDTEHSIFGGSSPTPISGLVGRVVLFSLSLSLSKFGWDGLAAAAVGRLGRTDGEGKGQGGKGGERLCYHGF